MSSESKSEPPPTPASSAAASAQEIAADLSTAATISKKQLKKEARKAEKAAHRQQQQQQTPAAIDAAEEDPFVANYGDIEVQSNSISGRSWNNVGKLGEGDDATLGCTVLVRGFLEAIRPVGKNMVFFVLRQSMSSVQCVLVANSDAGVSRQMVRFAAAISKESVVDVEGVVSLPKEPLKATTQQVCDIVGELFVSIFKHLTENCKKELETINRQYPFEPLKYLEQTLKLTYEEGIQMLKEAGTEIEPMGDLNTEAEKKLGRLVKEKYGTDFFILYRYPSAVRLFYTMPCCENPAYSNSFDAFIRGEEIISGAQRIHMPELLTKRAAECGIDTSTISAYVNSFCYGAPPHAGFGVGLERVVMLFCALNNIRKTSMFPRDPQRLTP
ncbi:hypothetical protein QOZ80_5AG0392780 [Eleusine coracana subsp. coracana]|nr:hypothetical protein QOZ80_5AG0392780 [Eleusine coracana subsp. coracana]